MQPLQLLTAPLSIAAPKFLFSIDRTEFTKTADEKILVKELKKQFTKTRKHKFIVYLKNSF